MSDLLARVRATCRTHELLRDGPVAVAVSGGPDSLALLHLLVELGGVSLVVVSVDHGLREASTAEVEGVARQARELGLPFRSVALNLEPGPGIQARARSARYAWFDSLPEPTVALGHHLDDQAETVLDRLARGSGSRGLAAMQPRRGRYVRPLLEVRRSDLEAWLAARGISGVSDPSNALGTRGALRHRVLPGLEEVRQGAAEGLARSARLLAQDDALLQELARPLWGAEGVEVTAWRMASTPLRRRAVLALAPFATARQVDDVLSLVRPGSWVAVEGGRRVALDGGTLRLLPPPPTPQELTTGSWGLWRVASDCPVGLRPPDRGEDAGGTPLRERLRAAGVGPALRPYHPVIELAGRRWVPGVWLEAGRPGGGSRVEVVRPATTSVPAGGPFHVEL